MSRVEIGVGILLTAIGALGIYDQVSIFTALVVTGVLFITLGTWDESLRPVLLLEERFSRWFRDRGWSVRHDNAAKRNGFYFWLWIEDPDSKHEVGVSRGAERKQVVTFTANVRLEDRWKPALAAFSPAQQSRLIQDIHVLLAIKSMGWFALTWPLDKLRVQTALPLDRKLDEHAMDITAKEVGHTTVAVRSLIRKALADAPSYSGAL